MSGTFPYKEKFCSIIDEIVDKTCGIVVDAEDAREYDAVELTVLPKSIGFRLNSFEFESVPNFDSNGIEIDIRCKHSGITSKLLLNSQKCTCPERNKNSESNNSYWEIQGGGSQTPVSGFKGIVKDTSCDLLPDISRKSVNISRTTLAMLLQNYQSDFAPDTNRDKTIEGKSFADYLIIKIPNTEEISSASRTISLPSITENGAPFQKSQSVNNLYPTNYNSLGSASPVNGTSEYYINGDTKCDNEKTTDDSLTFPSVYSLKSDINNKNEAECIQHHNSAPIAPVLFQRSLNTAFFAEAAQKPCTFCTHISKTLLNTSPSYLRNEYLLSNENIYEDVHRQWAEPSTDIQTCLENYDKVLTDLSQMVDKLRKVNIQLKLNAIHKFNEAPNERFTYPLPKCLEYDTGYESECVITYIKDAKNKLFYITETGENSNTEQIVSKMQGYFQDNPMELERTPRNGEVFGLHLKGYMFRAVKENGKSDKFSNFKAYLLDVGEIVTIHEGMQMYVLPGDYQKLPAQAVLCKLEELTVNDISPSEYLGKSLYVRHRFRIVDKYRTMLFVKLHADTNPFRNKGMTDSDSNAKNEEPVPQLTNPFKRSSNQGSEYPETLKSNNALNGNTMNGSDYSRNNELTRTVKFNNGFDMKYMGRLLNETLQNRKARVYHKPPTAFVKGRAAGVRKSLLNRVGPTDESAPPAEATVIPNQESPIGDLLSMGISAPAPAAPAVPASNIDLLGGGLDVLLGGPPEPAGTGKSGNNRPPGRYVRLNSTRDHNGSNSKNNLATSRKKVKEPARNNGYKGMKDSQ